MLGAVFGSFCFVTLAVVLSSLAILTWPLSPSGRLYHVFIQLWARLAIACARVKLRVEGREHIDRSQTYLVMSNHRSNFDVATLYRATELPLVFVAKRSLSYIPIFGWGLRLARFIFIDRQNREAALATLHRATSRLTAGQSICIFPEGTRSHDGRLLPFKKGGFVMALESGIPILPIGVRGTERILRKESALIWPGEAEVRIGAPIDVTAYRDRPDGKEALMDRVREEIARLAGVPAEPSAQAAPPNSGGS